MLGTVIVNLDDNRYSMARGARQNNVWGVFLFLNYSYSDIAPVKGSIYVRSRLANHTYSRRL